MKTHLKHETTTRNRKTKTRNWKPIRIAALAMTLTLSATAQGEIVLGNVDYNVGFSGDTQSGSAVVGTIGDLWNASPTFFGFGGTETNGNTGTTAADFGPFELLDPSGAASGISYQMTFNNDGFGFNGAFANPGAVAATDIVDLMADYAFVGGADAGESLDFVLSGLANDTTYTLYLYGNGDAAGQGALWTLDGVGKSTAFDATSTIDEGGEYVTFTFDTGTETTQAFSANELGGSIAINGFQLTTTAVPEPASAAVLFLAGAAGVAKRRRSKRRLVGTAA